MRMISPIFSNGFSKKPSKNWIYWLSDELENKYMRQYPRATKVFSVLMWIVFLLPSVLFVRSLVVLTWNGVEILGPLAGLGIIGCVLIGLGLGNIIAAFMHIYLGHLVTTVLMLSGVFILLATYYLIFFFA